MARLDPAIQESGLDEGRPGEVLRRLSQHIAKYHSSASTEGAWIAGSRPALTANPAKVHSVMEIDARAAVVAEARRWIGTPYHNCADIRGVGVDCGMLIVRVFVDTGLCLQFDPRPYPPDWHLHRGEERYLGFVFDRCAEVDVAQPGDVAVFRYGRCYSHGGIVSETDPLRIVHAFHPARRVVEQEVARDPELADPRRVPRFFSYWRPR